MVEQVDSRGPGKRTKSTSHHPELRLITVSRFPIMGGHVKLLRSWQLFEQLIGLTCSAIVIMCLLRNCPFCEKKMPRAVATVYIKVRENL
jgi:hypothetical protein